MTKIRKDSADAVPIKADADGWMTIPATARALRIAPQSVYALGVRGDLVTQVVAGRVFVHVDSVTAYAAKQVPAKKSGTTRGASRVSHATAIADRPEDIAADSRPPNWHRSRCTMQGLD